MNCAKCGAEIAVTEKTLFCPECGTRIEKPEHAIDVEPRMSEMEAEAGENVAEPIAVDEKNKPARRSGKTEKKTGIRPETVRTTKKLLKKLIVTAAVVMAGITGFVVYDNGTGFRDLKKNKNLEIGKVENLQITSEPVDGIYIAEIVDNYGQTGNFSGGGRSETIHIKERVLLNQNLEQLGESICSEIEYIPEVDRFAYCIYGNWGLMDREGKRITEAVYRKIKPETPNLLRAERAENSEGDVLINRDGKELAEGWDCSIHDVQGQIRISCTKAGDWGTAKYGIIDEQGNEIVPFEYSYINFYEDGIIKLGIKQKDDKYKMYFVDVDGKELVNAALLPWSWIGDYLGDGYIKVGSSSGKRKAIISMIYDQGKVYTETVDGVDQDYAAEIFYLGNDLFAVNDVKKKKWGIRNAQGREVWVFIYDEIIPLTEDLFAAKKGNQWGVCSLETGGEEVPIMFDEVRYLSDDFFGVRFGDLWGVCDSKGAEVLPCEYENINWEDGRSFCYMQHAWDDRIGVVSFADKEAGEYDGWILEAADVHGIYKSDFEDSYIHVANGNEYMLIETENDTVVIVGPGGQKIWNDTYVANVPDQSGYVTLSDRLSGEDILVNLLTGEKEAAFGFVFRNYDAIRGVYGVRVDGKIGIYQAGKGYLVEPVLKAAGCQVQGSNVATVYYKNHFSEKYYTVQFQ